MATKKQQPIRVTNFADLARAFEDGAASPNAPGKPITEAEPRQVPSTQTPERPINGNVLGNT
jgi:hypothetical protein